jgi:hypothetical protein
MRGSFGLALLGLGGCAQLAGIDKTNGDDRRVTLAYDRVSIGAKGATTAPLALDGLTASFLVPDETDDTVLDPMPADVAADGLWAAKIRDGTPPVLFTLPDNATHFFALPSRTMHGRFVALEHDAPSPPPMGAIVSVTSTLDTPSAAGESFSLLEVGAWASVALTVTPPAATIGPISTPYGLFSNLAAPLPLAAFTPDDVILVMRHTAGKLTGLGEMAPAEPQQVTTDVNIPIAAVTADQTLAMPLDAASIPARFGAEKPAGGALAMTYTVTAAPGFAQGVTAGPSLLSAVVPATATSLAGTYGNPFATTHMWPAALVFSASKSRTYAPMAGTGPSIGLTTSLNEVIAPDGATAISLDAALPQIITVGITPLATDGASVLIDATKQVPVSFTTDGGSASLFELDLYELTANGTAYDSTLKMSLVGDSPSWTLPQGYLLPGHRYLFRAMAFSGYGDPSTGDLGTVTLPYTVGIQDGGVFTVSL